MSEAKSTLAPPATRGQYSVASVPDGWYAACRAEEISTEPIGRTLLGTPVVLYRDLGGQAAALLDRCPHRNAPLSLGAVDESGLLACKYHGWRFDGTGACRAVPGLLDDSDPEGRMRSVPSFAVREQDGFVWVWGRANAKPKGEPVPIPHIDDEDYVVVIREFDVECTLHAALENALDVPHTAFLHRGDFRGKGMREIEAVRRRIPGGIEVEYIGEPPFTGETHDADGQPIVQLHWDRFFMPGVAQVEYKSGDARHLISTLPHTPVSDFRTRFWLVSCMYAPEAPPELAMAFEKQLETILGQDVEILREQTRRIREFGGEAYRSTELDLVGPEMLRMLKQAERGLPTDSADIERRVRFRVY